MKHTIKFLTVILFFGISIDNGISQGTRQEKKSIKSSRTKSSTRSDNEKSSGKSVRSEKKSVQKSGSEEKTLFEKYGFSSKEELYSFLEGKEIKKDAAAILKKYKSDDDLTDREKRILTKALDTHVKSSSSKSVKSSRTSISKEKADGRDASLRNSKKSKDSRKQGKGAIAKTKKRTKKSKSTGSRNLVASARLSTTTAVDLGGSGCTSANPCDVGESDCDSDSDCAGNLKCYQRSEAGDAPPGVSIPSGFIASHDICYDPGIVTASNLGGSGCTSSNPCDVGEGDCDSDSDCSGSLFCYQRDSGLEDVPGVVFGSDFPDDYDVCYEPVGVIAVDLGGSGCTSSNPCDVGGSDCDSDSDCIGDLECYQRSEADDAPPGVVIPSGFIATHDICYDPTSGSGGIVTFQNSAGESINVTNNWDVTTVESCQSAFDRLFDENDLIEIFNELLHRTESQLAGVDRSFAEHYDLTKAIFGIMLLETSNCTGDKIEIHQERRCYSDLDDEIAVSEDAARPLCGMMGLKDLATMAASDESGQPDVIKIPMNIFLEAFSTHELLIQYAAEIGGCNFSDDMERSELVKELSMCIVTTANPGMPEEQVEFIGNVVLAAWTQQVQSPANLEAFGIYWEDPNYANLSVLNAPLSGLLEEEIQAIYYLADQVGIDIPEGAIEDAVDFVGSGVQDVAAQTISNIGETAPQVINAVEDAGTAIYDGVGSLLEDYTGPKKDNGETCSSGNDVQCKSDKCGQYKDDQYKCCSAISTWWGEDWCTDLPNGTAVYDKDQCSSGYKSESGKCASKKDNGESCSDGDDSECASDKCGQYKDDQYKCCAKISTWWGEDWCTDLPNGTSVYDEDQCDSGYKSGSKCAAKKKKGRCDDDDECASGYTCINNYSGGKKYCRKEKYEVCGGAGCYNRSKGWPGESGFKSKLPDNYRCRYDDQCNSGNCSGNAYGVQNGRCD